jgi:hypothetical protein
MKRGTKKICTTKIFIICTVQTMDVGNDKFIDMLVGKFNGIWRLGRYSCSEKNST